MLSRLLLAGKTYRSARTAGTAHPHGRRLGHPTATASILLHPQLQQGQQQRQCGFLAAIGPAASASSIVCPLLTDEALMQLATSKLEHRGPDGRFVKLGTFPSSANETTTLLHWSLGHQRLAIVDPHNHAADMPFVLYFPQAQTTIHLVANGEIYNHDILYDDLVKSHGWDMPRQSKSDCEVIAHAIACLGPEATCRKLDGMFAFTAFIHDHQHHTIRTFCARDPVGIKPIYTGNAISASSSTTSSSSSSNTSTTTKLFASELKALVGHVDPTSVTAIPPGHYWSNDTGLVRYHQPPWLYQDDPTLSSFTNAAAAENDDPPPTADELLHGFTNAVSKRMMADVDYGYFLSGGVDSCILSHALLPLYRASTNKSSGDYIDDRPIPAYTVGMADSPDLMAATAMVDALGGSRYVDHRPRIFTIDDVLPILPHIVYHMESYESELIRSAIPNWLLAERAAADVKMVLTGEGADELFAGYLYFMDAPNGIAVQYELQRLYRMLGDINLHRTDRMTMAHGLEARVPFLDTAFTALAMRIPPEQKLVDRNAVMNNTVGREKTFLRQLFAGPNANGHTIPHDLLWRAKAMQCEGVGEDWVSLLQRHVAKDITDAELSHAKTLFEINPPQTKEELYYRRIFEDHFPGMAHVVNAWEGGCRAAGASWTSDTYTRAGLVETNVLTHNYQNKMKKLQMPSQQPQPSPPQLPPIIPNNTSSRNNDRTEPATTMTHRGFATLAEHPSSSVATVNEMLQMALDAGLDQFQAMLTTGGDDRCMILPETHRNKYHIQPKPMAANAVFRGSCTCSPPTQLGYQAAQVLYDQINNSPDPHETVATVFRQQRERLAQFFQLLPQQQQHDGDGGTRSTTPAGTEIILCPSGSDAEYLPVVIAKALHPHRPIVNVVTQLKEVGAGTSAAAGGLYFSTHAPLLGRVPDGVERLAGFDNVSTICIPARKKNGTALDSSRLAQEAADQAVRTTTGAFPILHGVFGGKTGLLDETMPASQDAGRRSLGVVDACQGRFSLADLHGWLAQDSIVLITGSKFYQAPPFCGAVLVPKSIADQLRARPAPGPLDLYDINGLGGFMTEKELPECLSSWAPMLQANQSDANIGLALRWEAALAEMESLSHVSDDRRSIAVRDWATSVRGMVEQESVYLDAWCVHGSIVSIRLRHGDRWLNMKELRDVYRLMSLSDIPAPPNATRDEIEALGVICSLGQPVDVAESHAILRMALGSESLRSFLADPELTLQQDAGAVKKLAVIAKYYNELKDA
jgi:asparagine synthase (glutamine-hydrolysing)